jgi:NosR/NirI family nitrous oxide reductase transcriptional regulator
MSTQHANRSCRKALVSIVLLISAIMFDGGGNMMGYFLNGNGLHSGVQAANADHTSLRLLKAVIAEADSFSDKEGEVPVYKAYRTDPASGEKTLIGYAFVTADTLPEPNGFSGPIDSLVGMDLEGNIIGIRVVYYKESLRGTWGDFLSEPWFRDQFIGMRATDSYRVGKDIDGISRATISAKAMGRGVRNSVRAVTKAYLQ